MNLFSIFDPRISIFKIVIGINWIRILLIFLFLLPQFWIISCQLIKIVKILIFTLEKEIKINFGQFVVPGIRHFIVVCFFLIFLNNYLGLSPYIFTASRHLRFTLTLALSSWISYFVWNLIKDLNKFISHLVPLGTPYVLIPLMIIIELIRNVIRPLTLSVRLAANIVAGHLLLTLISSPLTPQYFFIFQFLIIILILIIILENAVAVIQGYVFRILSSLYISERNSSLNYLNNLNIKIK